MKRSVLILLAFILAGGLMLGGCAKPAPAPAPAPSPAPAAPPPPAPKPKTYEFSAVTFAPVTFMHVIPFKQWTDEVNKASNGQIVIKLRGGPEAIPLFEQHNAVGKGVVDINLTPSGYYVAQVPEALGIPLSTLTPQREREVGFLDFMREVHAKKKNVFLIGRGLITDDQDFMLFTNTRIRDIRKDLQGAKLRSGGTLYVPLYEALGVTGITMPQEDVYTGLERGLVNGYALPISRTASDKLYEVVKYGISPGFWTNQTQILMNLDKWNELPKNLQQIMMDAQVKLEPGWRTWYDGEKAKDVQAVKKGGMEIIELPPDQAKWFKDAANAGPWGEMKAKATPEAYSKLRKMLLGE